MDEPKNFPIFTRNGGWKLGAHPFDWEEPDGSEDATEVHQQLTEEQYNETYSFTAGELAVTVYCNWNPGLGFAARVLEPTDLLAVIQLRDDCFLVGIEDQTALFSFIRYMREVAGGAA